MNSRSTSSASTGPRALDPDIAVASVSEAQIIATLLEAYPAASDGSAGPSVVLGIGDDAALLRVPGGQVLTSVDSIVERQDFLREWPCGYRTTGRDVGFKSAAQNLSDINAMGGRSLSAVVALALSPDVPLSWVRGYAEGVGEAVRVLGATDFTIAGGDLSSAGEISAVMTVFGVPSGRVLTRGGAGVGDLVVIAGRTLGRADVALSLLSSTAPEDAVEHWGERESEVAAAQFRPLPPLSAGPEAALAPAGAGLSALMDVSDGLVRDASRLARASGVGIVLDPEAIALEAGRLREWAGRHAGDAEARVLFGGEDHLLLGTCSRGARVPEGFRVIGTTTRGGGVFLGERALDPSKGFDHFRG